MAGLIGAIMTSVYTFRLIFIVFHGEVKTEVHSAKSLAHSLPLVTLIVLSTFVGALITPPLANVLPLSEGHFNTNGKHYLELASSLFALSGIVLAFILYRKEQRPIVNKIANNPFCHFLTKWWFAAWGFDWLYDKAFVQPYLWLTNALRSDYFNTAIGVIPIFVRFSHKKLVLSVNGNIRWYATSIVGGFIFMLTLLIFLA